MSWTLLTTATRRHSWLPSASAPVSQPWIGSLVAPCPPTWVPSERAERAAQVAAATAEELDGEEHHDADDADAPARGGRTTLAGAHLVLVETGSSVESHRRPIPCHRRVRTGDRGATQARVGSSQPSATWAWARWKARTVGSPGGAGSSDWRTKKPARAATTATRASGSTSVNRR